MDCFAAMAISASGLQAQRVLLSVISSNLANANTTRTDTGGPYRRQDLLLATSLPRTPFGLQLEEALRQRFAGVKVVGVVEDLRPFKVKYSPDHPDADEKGYVAFPNVNIMEEMANMLIATRAYEANVTALNGAKDMILKALQIGR